MSDIKAIERPAPTNEDSLLDTDFQVYTASIRAKRFKQYLKHDKDAPLLSHTARQYVSTKTLATSPAINKKMKKVYRAHSIVHFLSSPPKTKLKKPTTEDAQTREKTINILGKTLVKAEKLHIAVNELIQKHRHNQEIKVSETELGYLSRLALNKLDKMPHTSEAPKTQRHKTVDEIQDILNIIKSTLTKDLEVFTSIERKQTMRDKNMVSKTNKQINKLLNLQKVLFPDTVVPLQREISLVSVRFG